MDKQRGKDNVQTNNRWTDSQIDNRTT